MVIHCKHCGATMKVDEARMPTTAFRVKCHQCQNVLTVEPPKPGAAPPHAISPIPVSPALASPTSGRRAQAPGKLPPSTSLGGRAVATVVASPPETTQPLP